ncbi:sugar transferase [Candidatus Peregrinibacteria bacterium]|jgi:exopolysaccharide biosynthesis polyprenyl glycosylphosphotransferase|nr:sugar transferase [Candidatus Peregrinibacteria bacterium]MBT7484565.1 sugar transferase [Candidatus Peregrinibacteria bacterium]MBT7703607.1 sugar transferase [Candidatus Peregrinibacteria bacterium]
MKKSEIIFGILRIPLDFGMVILATLVAYHMRQYSDLIPGMHFPVDILNFPTLPEYLQFAGWAALALIVVFAVNHMYAMKNSGRIGNEVIRVFSLVSAWIMLIIAYYFVTRQFFFSRLVLGYIWISAVIFVSSGRVIMRLFQRWLTKYGIGRRRILFIGKNILTNKICEKLKFNPAYYLKGALTQSGRPIKNSPLRILGKITELEKIIKRHQIEEIIQTKSDLPEAEAHKIIDFCREHHIQYHFVPDVLQIHKTEIDVFNIAGLPLISLKMTPLDGWGKVYKRIFDIIFSSLLLIILSPSLLIIAIYIKLDSRGPVIFSKKDNGEPVKRVGEHGKLFKFYKFRTMKPKTDNLRYKDLNEKSHRQGSPLVKIKNDPRITRFGKHLRRWSLDELPQLWSVFAGKMSLVGPRPHLPEEVAKYKKHHKFVLNIKPGITGLAQVNGRSDLNFEEEVRYDTFYIEKWSPLLDLKILARTLLVVLGGQGAD